LIATEVSGEGFSIEPACKVLNLSRSVYYYKAVKDDTAVIDKLNELSEAYPTRGF
jgi:putative transposase